MRNQRVLRREVSAVSWPSFNFYSVNVHFTVTKYELETSHDIIFLLYSSLISLQLRLCHYS